MPPPLLAPFPLCRTAPAHAWAPHHHLWDRPSCCAEHSRTPPPVFQHHSNQHTPHIAARHNAPELCTRRHALPSSLRFFCCGYPTGQNRRAVRWRAFCTRARCRQTTFRISGRQTLRRQTLASLHTAPEDVTSANKTRHQDGGRNGGIRAASTHAVAGGCGRRLRRASGRGRHAGGRTNS